jgi:hypothetical protein
MEEKEAGNVKRVRDRAMSKPSEFVVEAKKKGPCAPCQYVKILERYHISVRSTPVVK